jgi:hypothetical protein
MESVSVIDNSPLLSQEQSMARAQPLRAWSAAQLKTVAGLFQEVWDAWVFAWGLEEDGVSVVSARTPGASGDDLPGAQAGWERVSWPQGIVGKASIRWAFDAAKGDVPPESSSGRRLAGPKESALASLERWLFGSDAPRAESLQPRESSLGAKVAAEAWNDFWRRLGSVAPDQDGDSTPQAGSSADSLWSGDVHVDIPWSHGVVSVLLSGGQVARLINHTMTPRQAEGVSSSFTPLLQALSPQALRIRAEFKPVEMTLAQLQGLRIGDVVQIPHQLDAPVQVVILKDYRLCSGWLGQQDGHVAVELTE